MKTEVGGRKGRHKPAIQGRKPNRGTTRFQTLKLKCPKFAFRWELLQRLCPRPRRGAYSAPPDLLAIFKGRGREDEGMEGDIKGKEVERR